jgi:carboxypeptidase T
MGGIAMPYLNVGEVESALTTLAGHPPNAGFTELLTLPLATWEGRMSHAIRIGSGSGPRTGVYIIGGLHAREWGSSDILVFLLERVAQAYHTSSGITLGSKVFSAAQIAAVVNTLDLFVFPQVNPDGRNYSMNVDTCWRKNRRPIAGGAGCAGVDLNRNYDFLWNFPTYFSSSAAVQSSTTTCGICNSTGYQTYIGPSAASEPETQNVVSILDGHPNIRFMIDVHSYSQKILYNWGDDDDQTVTPGMNFNNAAYNGQRGVGGDAYSEFIPAGERSLQITLANRMQSAIAAVRGKGYLVEPSFDLYPTSGTSIDYAYSRHFLDGAKSKVYGFVIEWGQEFQPPYAEMSNIIEDIAAGLLEFCVGVTDTLADLRIRDNLGDTGAVPVTGAFWESPDIAVRNADDGIVVDQPALTGQTNYVFVQMTNAGPAPSGDVHVNLRAVRFPGTEFSHPADWTAVDATHILPTAVTADFPLVAPGATAVAKFSLSPAQISTLYGWQGGGWHPCLLAEITTGNDYSPTSGVHVWDNNNLAQRNISIVLVSLQALESYVAFPFLFGNAMDRAQSVTLRVDRSSLPETADVLLDLTDRDLVFEEATRPERDRGEVVTFPERSRLELEACGTAVDISIAAGSRIRLRSGSADPTLGIDSARSETYEGRSVWRIMDRAGSVRVDKRGAGRRQGVLRMRLPDHVKDGDEFLVRVIQEDSEKRSVGGVSVNLVVRA